MDGYRWDKNLHKWVDIFYPSNRKYRSRRHLRSNRWYKEMREATNLMAKEICEAEDKRFIDEILISMK